MKFKALEIITMIMASIIVIFIGYNLYFDIKVKSINNKEDITVISKEDNSNITIDIKKGSEYASSEGILAKFIIIPQMAIWMEDTDGNFIKTIYVTPKYSKIKRDSALPVWSHLNGVKVDTKASATPKGNSSIKIVKPNVDRFNILLEVNKSYDSNKYYNIGEEYNGQPSLIYLITINNTEKTYKMKLYGHGSSTGVDGLIYKDVSGMTTAKKILKEIKITLE